MIVVVADPDAGFRSRAAAGIDGVGDVVHATGGTEIVAALDGHRADGGVVVLGPNIPADRVFAMAERIHEAGQRFGVVAFADTVTEQVLREALRAGVSDVLARDFEATELRDAVKRAGSQGKVRGAEVEGEPPPADAGRVVHGGRLGPGTGSIRAV
jgi:DNA-binding NarL/FixJ family response regulator